MRESATSPRPVMKMQVLTRRIQLVRALSVFGVGLGLTTAPAQAAVVLLGTFSGSECGGRGGFSNCYAYQTGTAHGQTGDGSPAIFKYNFGGGTEVSALFPSVSGLEFDVDYLAEGNTLSFAYNAGEDDPSVHYFAVKQGNKFSLFYDASPITSGSIALSNYFPENPGYSHITFFDTGSISGVPEPATWAMMLLGFGAIGFAIRRRKSNNQNVRLRIAYR